MTEGAATAIDIRTLSAMERHPTILKAVKGLSKGESLVLIADHEPRPLYLRLTQLYEKEFEWEYLEAGPRVWRVRIKRS